MDETERKDTSEQPVDPKPQPSSETDPSPLRSVHTDTFARLLTRFNISLAVTTYQAGKLVLLRPQVVDGKALVNTHFRNFQKPMGFAWERGHFAVGTNSEIWEFHDIPAVAPKLQQFPSLPPFDSVFLPRLCNMTGDMQIHEMVWLPSSSAHQLTKKNISLNSGSSTPGSPASQPEAKPIVSSPAGVPLLSPPSPPKTAVISTAWPFATEPYDTSPL